MEGGDTGGNLDRDQMGITQRGIYELFERIKVVKQSESSRHFSVFVSYLQIYNEKVFDLLNPQHSATNGVSPTKKNGVAMD